MARVSKDPLSLATGALTFLLGLAQKGAGPDRMQRETAAIIEGWLAEAADEEARLRFLEAASLLGDQLASGIEQTAEMVDDLDREDAAGVRAGERLLASLRSATSALAEGKNVLF